MNDFYDVDFSCYDFPSQIWDMLSWKEILIRTFILLPIGVFGIVGNCLLLHVIYGNRTLQTPTNYLIFNMAISDLLVLLCCPGLFLFHEIFQNYKLGEIGCKADGMIEVSLLITSVITICLISYDRLTAIAFPMKARLNFKTTKIMIAISWISGLVLSSPLAIFRSYQERHWKNFVESFCTENLKVLPLYWHVLVIALVWVPMAVLVFCYSMIFWKLDRYEKSRKKRDNPIQIINKRKCTITLFIVVLSFILLRLPFTALVFIRYNMLQNSEMNQVQGSFHVLWYISHFLIFLDSSLTPIIYGVMNENFRRAFRQTKLHKLFCSCCTTKDFSTTVGIFTFGSIKTRNNYQLEPRNPIVTNRKLLTPNWMNFEWHSKHSSNKSQKVFSRDEKSQEKFKSTESFI
ncbi:CLUMA_CG000453, isoform A [Clunio marinus]|uniref:CLUMA_CG000453, isoform A n=1 Tax=Clunio marinus TaxID=568069 RepID=A0A1J1HF58_9DIPT|nr:CLUMA_CG000453, isoform A [Clunio marinus]